MLFPYFPCLFCCCCSDRLLSPILSPVPFKATIGPKRPNCQGHWSRLEWAKNEIVCSSVTIKRALIQKLENACFVCNLLSARVSEEKLQSTIEASASPLVLPAFELSSRGVFQSQQPTTALDDGEPAAGCVCCFSVVFPPFLSKVVRNCSPLVFLFASLCHSELKCTIHAHLAFFCRVLSGRNADGVDVQNGFF